MILRSEPRGCRIFFPLGFGLLPALSLYAENWRIASLGDALVTMIVAGVGAGLVWEVAGRLLGGRSRGAVFTVWFLLLFYSYRAQSAWVSSATEADTGPGHPFLLPALAGLVILGWAVIRKLPRPTVHLMRGLNVVSAAAAIGPIVILLYGLKTVETSGPGDEVTSPELTLRSAGARLPDIYYVIPDGYARDDTLQRVFGYDNRPFLAELEARGFYVARESHSNYNQTYLSLASSLNLDYLHNLPIAATPERTAEGGRRPLQELIGRSRIRQILESTGYLFATFPSGYSATRFPEPDILIQGGWAPTEYQNVFLSMTPLPDLLSVTLGLSPYDWHRRRVKNILDHLGSLAGQYDAPLFVVAHIYLPHPPFVFDADGEPVNPNHPFAASDGSHYFADGGSREEYLRGYPQQVAYLNRRLLQAIDQIVARSQVPPLIIIQGDHGSGLGTDHDSLERTDLDERFGILNAYHLPGVPGDQIGAGISPVNSFRLVLSGYFGADLPQHANQSFFSVWTRPYEAVYVSPRLKPRRDP